MANEQVPTPRHKAPPKRKKQVVPPTGQRPHVGELSERELPEVYYDETTMGYWVRVHDEEFVRFSETAIKRTLKRRGYSGEGTAGLSSEIDELIDDIQFQRYVRYAGPLAGFKAGREVIMGKPILVTESPKVIEATHGTNMIVRDYVDRLLGKPHARYLHGWLKLGREAFLAGNLRRGQVMVLAGDRDHGKSLLAQQIIVALFGGRAADPHQGMRNQTTFNKDWFGAEVLLLDDPGSDDRWSTRRQFGDAIKQMVGNKAPRCHGKGKDALILTPFWRMIVCLNDDLEALQVLPPMDRFIKDKIIVLKTRARAVTDPTATSEQYVAYERKLRAGLGDYLGWLERWQVPAELSHDRFAIRAFQDPEIVEALTSFTPELKLWHLIAEEILCDAEDPVTLTAREVEAMLKMSGSNSERDAHDLLRGPGACGKYLARLTRAYPQRCKMVGRVSGGGAARYKLCPDPRENE